jgi:uncharacterized protein YndB with AHSA1/START domain
LKEKLNFDAFYPHEPLRVWQALTDPAQLTVWLMPADFKPSVGFRFRIGDIRGEVLEVREGEMLKYTWDDGEEGSPSVITWTLKPKDGGTHLTLEHEAATETKPYVLIEAAANWKHALARLPMVPIVYGEDLERAPVLARAGFRQPDLQAADATEQYSKRGVAK